MLLLSLPRDNQHWSSGDDTSKATFLELFLCVFLFIATLAEDGNTVWAVIVCNPN